MAETIKFDCRHEDCIYRGTIQNGRVSICNYCLIEHRSRGCKVEDCDKYMSADGMCKKVSLNKLFEFNWLVQKKDRD